MCKVKSSLYGLKQAPRQWYKKLDAFMLKHGFKRSHADHYLYTKKDATPLGVPLQPHVKLPKGDCPKDDDATNYMKNIPYASVCG